jgi:hypothetical protein
MPDTWTILDEAVGESRLVVTARPGLDGEWLVTFIRRNSRRKFLDQCAAWMPNGEWDGSRWLPFRCKHVPPDAMARVQEWLRDRPEVAEVAF